MDSDSQAAESQVAPTESQVAPTESQVDSGDTAYRLASWFAADPNAFDSNIDTTPETQAARNALGSNAELGLRCTTKYKCERHTAPQEPRRVQTQYRGVPPGRNTEYTLSAVRGQGRGDLSAHVYIPQSTLLHKSS